ncbi:hypothetical protein ACFWNG_05540 [Streptomyces sp. NPDC058391]|uniref:hypothetical protein n=1 Tax=Streptomyces sp. NPDC058391 TaxID=3346476 RepID=UPI0036612C3A
MPPHLSIALVEEDFERRIHRQWRRLRERSRQWVEDFDLMPAEMGDEFSDALRFTDVGQALRRRRPDHPDHHDPSLTSRNADRHGQA